MRDRSASDQYWIEFGFRVIPNWKSPNDDDPRMLSLALAASLSSGTADDARWLDFSDFGFQLYGMIQSRTEPWVTRCSTLLLGAVYGGEASLWPLSVRSWLGPQTGVIGNAFLEVFVDAPVLFHTATNLQIGAHGEASLSSIWPGNDPFPVLGNVFLGWSPAKWLSARVFGGIAGSPNGTVATNYPYGVRLEFFVP